MNDLKTQFAEKGTLLVWGTLAVLAGAALLLFAEFFGAMKEIRFIGQEIDRQNTITVSGEGEIPIIPDTAEFSFAVVQEGETVADAQKGVTNTMNALLKYLDDFGVQKQDVKTTNYRITPRYEYRIPEEDISGRTSFYPPHRTRVLSGYEVSHWVSVKVEKIDAIGTIVSEIGNRGATNISNIRFTIEDEEAAERDARKAAIEDAKEKAKVLARDLGVRLGHIVSFSESGRATPLYRGYDAAIFEEGGSVAPPAPEIPAGENTITSNVTIVWIIE